MHPPRWTASQAAREVGRDLDTIKRWKRTGVYRPSECRKFGSLEVDLYTTEDIAAMKAIARSMKPGRKASA